MMSEKEKDIKENVHEEPMQFYIPPMATSASHFYKIYLTFAPDVPMANIHAYKTVYSLREIAEDLLHFPEDLVSDASSADEILENGFKILLQAQTTEEELREIIKEGYDITKVDIVECTGKEFQQGFDSFGSEIRIDLESSVEEIREKAEAAEMIILPAATEKAAEKAPEKPPRPPNTSGLIVFFTCSFINSTDL